MGLVTIKVPSTVSRRQGQTHEVRLGILDASQNLSR